MRVPLFLALASVVLSCSSLRLHLPTCGAPSPLLQLDNWKRHRASSQGSSQHHVAVVTARENKKNLPSNNCDNARTWLIVGAVSCMPSTSLECCEGHLFAAVQCQRRLITEHACRLHPNLRFCKREPGVELGILSLASSSSNDDNSECLPPGGDCGKVGVVAVPPSAPEGEPSDVDMKSAGFVGQQESMRRSSSLYLDAWRAFLEDHASSLSAWSEIS